MSRRVIHMYEVLSFIFYLRLTKDTLLVSIPYSLLTISAHYFKIIERED